MFIYSLETDLYVDTTLHTANSEEEVTPDANIESWEQNYFGDCWLKLLANPEPYLNDDGTLTVDGIQCRVTPPGQHPGGQAWWITPIEPVYTPVYSEDQS